MAIKVYASVSGNVLNRNRTKVKSARTSHLGDPTSAICLMAGSDVAEVVRSDRSAEAYESAHFILPREYHERLIRRREGEPTRYVSTLQIEQRYPYCSTMHFCGENKLFEDVVSNTSCALLALDSNNNLCLSRFDVTVYYRLI